MTVLQSLNAYYGRMAERGEADIPGFSREKISFRVILAEDGTPVSVIDLRAPAGRKLVPVPLSVPAAVSRTSGVKTNLLWDKTAYSLGRTVAEGRRTAEEHAAFKAGNLALIAGSDDPGLVALRLFLESWLPERFDGGPFSPEMLDTNIVFALEGERNDLHEREAAQALLAARLGGTGTRACCLVTGLEAPIARLHPAIKGVWGAQSSGAALVSFNLDAFTSYNKEQGDNAPTSEAAVFRYTTALNRMLGRDSRNRLPRPVGDAALVFWADLSAKVDEKQARAAEDAFADFLEPPATDASETKSIREDLEKLAEGRPVATLNPMLEPTTRFHVLGLAPNAARLSVRYWLDDDFSVFAARLGEHHAALRLEPSPWRDKPPSISILLVKTTALQEKFENIPPHLAGEVMRAVLTGTAYPRSWLAQAVMRLRAGDSPAGGWHAAVIKACLCKKIKKKSENENKEKEPPVSLDPHNPSPAYQLGRLFAVLEAAQYAALGRVNASIADRYYGAASATPARVFGALLRGARTHVSDAQKRNKGFWIMPRMEQIMGCLPAELPRSLRLEDQGRFAIGYFHERAFRPEKPTETGTDATPPLAEETL